MVQRALEATPLTLHATAQEAFLEGSARQQCVSHLVKMAASALGLAGVFAEMYPIMLHARQVSMYVCQLHSYCHSQMSSLRHYSVASLTAYIVNSSLSFMSPCGVALAGDGCCMCDVQ